MQTPTPKGVPLGLDMYLKADEYISGYDFSGPDSQAKFKAIVQTVGLEQFVTDEHKAVQVQVTVAYWRKANAIHNWFVENIQGGRDECQSSWLDKEKLVELYDTVALALAAYKRGDNTQAQEILPPTSGFFFGGTEIDEGYEYDLTNTLKQLKPLIESDKLDSFIYQASW